MKDPIADIVCAAQYTARISGCRIAQQQRNWLIYETKEGIEMPGGMRMPWLCGWVWSWLFLCDVKKQQRTVVTISLGMGGWMGKRSVRRGWPVAASCNEGIKFLFGFALCTANERTPGGPLLHHLHRLCSVHLLPDDHSGHICYPVVSNFNFVPAEHLWCGKASGAFRATG